MITILYGKDDFSVHEALASLKSELDSDGMLADSTDHVVGSSARPDALLALCQTTPFLSAHRLVVVEGLLGRFEPSGRRPRRGKKKETALGPWETFSEGLQALPESTALVFLDGPLTARNPLLQALRPLAEVREFKLLRQAEVAGWINQRAQRYGVVLEARAVVSLATLVGSQLWILDSELQKLAVYANGQPVT
ncbi:MAG: hypothetical protein IIC88_02035, partial [Chloroflexi bacterium]|nr:hypothetical protein [Chloroflexota bacterium]